MDIDFDRRGQVVRHKTENTLFWGVVSERHGEPVEGWTTLDKATLYTSPLRHPEQATGVRNSGNDWNELRTNGEVLKCVETGRRVVLR